MNQAVVIELLEGVVKRLKTEAAVQARSVTYEIFDRTMTTSANLLPYLKEHAQCLRNVVFVENLIRDLKSGQGNKGQFGVDEGSYYRMLEHMLREGIDDEED